MPNMFNKNTRHLRVITMETPCTIDIATAVTAHCIHLQRLSITIDKDADSICQEITLHSKNLLSFKILFLNGINMNSLMQSESIEDFFFSREPSVPCTHTLPDMQFPLLRTLVYRICYISEEQLLHISKSCLGLVLLDIRCCITGPRSGIEKGLQALWNCCKHMQDIRVPPRI